MKKNYNQDTNFDKIIRQKMTGMEGVPAFDAWDNITAELDKDKAPPYRNWWGTSSVLLLLLIGGAIFWKKDTLFDTEEHSLIAVSVIAESATQKRIVLPENGKNNFKTNLKNDLIKNNKSKLVKEGVQVKSVKNTEDYLTKVEGEKSKLDKPKESVASNFAKNKISTPNKNTGFSKKATLITVKDNNSINSIKKAVVASSKKTELKEDFDTKKVSKNITQNSVINKAEKFAQLLSEKKNRKINFSKIGLIKLENDLQLTDYQSVMDKTKPKKIEIKKAKRFVFAFTPLRTYKHLIANVKDSMIVSNFEDTETLQTRTSFALTLGMERELNDRWEAEWGINYSRIEQNMNFLYSKKSTPITILFDTNQNGFDTRPVQAKEAFAHKYAYNYLGIYGGASYRIFRYAMPEQRLGARFTFATLLNQDKKLNTLQESVTAFYKVSYPLSAYWSFNVSPEFNYYFRSTYKKEALLGAKPFSVGLQLGLVRRFGAKK